MRNARLYIAQPLGIGSTVQLDQTASHYLYTVLRAKLGAKIILFNGEGGEFEGNILDLSKRAAVVKVTTFIDRNIVSPLHIHLAQSIPQATKMSYIIQQAVELGVNEITPIISQYTSSKMTIEIINKRLAHWQGIIISACEQCGRNDVPIIHAPKKLSEFMSTQKNEICIVLQPHSEKTLNDLNDIKAITILVGPESGFTEDEIQQLKDNHIACISFGPRILRTETAGPACIAALQTRWGDL